MNHLSYLFILFVIENVISKPTIIDANRKLCSYNISGRNLSFSGVLWEGTTVDHNYKINFSFCGSLVNNLNCGENVAVCLFDTQRGVYRSLGRSLVADDTGLLLSRNGEKCSKNKIYSLAINFVCYDSAQIISPLTKSGDCEFSLTMMSPDCIPRCTTRVNGYLVDLRSLTNSMPVSTAQRNFWVTLCGADRNCGIQISGCEIENGESRLPLLTTDSQHVVYNTGEQELSVRGKFNIREKKFRYFKMIIKCNFEKELFNATYKVVNRQGKNYNFEIHSSFGCVKTYSNCEVRSSDARLIYNVSKLNNPVGFWEVKNVPRSRKIFLNICAPLKLPQTLAQNYDGYTQVYEYTNGKSISHGKVFSNFITSGDLFQLSILYGSPCGNSTKYRKTEIEFTCSLFEEGPIYMKEDECVTYISWKTNEACPIYVPHVCDHMKPQPEKCSYSTDREYFDLSPLVSNRSIEITDPVNKYIQYKFAVCTAVIDEDAPCDTTSMVVMKNLSEPNIQMRVKSLGRVTSPSMLNNKLTAVMMGTICKLGTSYKSYIYFECGQKEEGPQLIKSEHCTYHFKWKTPFACPTQRDCNLGLLFKNERFNILKEKNITINASYSVYTFNLCTDQYEMCSQEECSNHHGRRVIITDERMPQLEFDLNRTCHSVDKFNKTKFEFICDYVGNNEHLQNVKLDGCTLKIDYKTSAACTEKAIEVPQKIQKSEASKQAASNITDIQTNSSDGSVASNKSSPGLGVPKKYETRKYSNCTITNQYTGYELNISSFRPTHVPPNSNCPTVVFNYTNNFILLEYDSNICRESGGPHISYVELSCSDEMKNFRLKENTGYKCSETFQYDSPSVCKLLENSPERRASASVSAISFGTLGAITILGGLIFIILYGRRKLKKRAFYESIYVKDTTC